MASILGNTRQNDRNNNPLCYKGRDPFSCSHQNIDKLLHAQPDSFTARGVSATKHVQDTAGQNGITVHVSVVLSDALCKHQKRVRFKKWLSYSHLISSDTQRVQYQAQCKKHLRLGINVCWANLCIYDVQRKCLCTILCDQIAHIAPVNTQSSSQRLLYCKQISNKHGICCQNHHTNCTVAGSLDTYRKCTFPLLRSKVGAATGINLAQVRKEAFCHWLETIMSPGVQILQHHFLKSENVLPILLQRIFVNIVPCQVEFDHFLKLGRGFQLETIVVL